MIALEDTDIGILWELNRVNVLHDLNLSKFVRNGQFMKQLEQYTYWIISIDLLVSYYACQCNFSQI